MYLKSLIVVALCMVFIWLSPLAQAGEIELAWEAPSDLSTFAKYRIYWGNQTGVYDQYKEVSNNNTSTVVANLSNKKNYYFVATTVTNSGMESVYSREVNVYLDADTDRDGILDQDEVGKYGSDPTRADTDGDGIDDGRELAYWQTAWNQDIDGDGQINLLDQDADNDGVADGAELSDKTDPADPGSFIKPGGVIKQFIEAEAHDGDHFGLFQIVADASASCGAYIEVAPGTNAYDAPPSDGYAEYNLTLAEASSVAIWLRVRIPEPLPGGNDSFWVDVSDDDRSWHKYNSIDRGVDWHWVEWTAQVGPRSLAAGDHTLTIAYREDGAMLDKLLITTDLNFQPTDAGAGGCGASATQFIEAEAHDGANFAPYTVQSDRSASGGSYIVVPNGVGSSYDDLPLDGVAEYDFHLPEASTVAIWLRVRIPEPFPGSNDSFWMDLDRDNYGFRRWNNIPHGTDWHWVEWTAEVNPIDLPAGDHVLEIFRREDGVELDCIVITTDLNFIP